MKFDLAGRVRRPSRKPIVLSNIAPTQAQAGDLALLYLKIVAVWREAQQRVIDEYEQTLGTLTLDAPNDMSSQFDSIEAEIRRLVLQLTPDLRRWALQVERVHRGKWVANVLSATSVDLDTVLSPNDVSDTLEASLEWNTALIRDVSDEIRRKIANAVFSGFQQRKPARDIAKEISETLGMARARARRIAADQTVKLGARLNRARQEQAGLTSFKWRHSGKLHPRNWHKARDGKVYPWEGSSIPDDDMPGVPPFCGCTAQGVITFDE